MSLRGKLLVVLCVVGILPCALAGVLAYRANRAELLTTLGEAQKQEARALGSVDEQFILNAVQSLQSAQSYLPFDSLSSEELQRVLQIPLRQMPFLNIIALLDENGRALSPPLRARAGADSPDSGGSPKGDDTPLGRFARHVPLDAANEQELAVSSVYRDARGSECVAVAARLKGTVPRFLVAEVSISEISGHAEELRAEGGLRYLVGPRGTAFASSAAGPLSADEIALVAAARQTPEGVARVVTRADHSSWLMAATALPRVGWVSVLAEPTARALRPATRVRDTSLYWLGVGAAMSLVLGLVMARGVTQPLAALSQAARSVTSGVPAAKVSVDSDDELGQFATAFNHMTGELERREREIRGWNAELQSRVELKTQELEAAMDQISRTRRLSALSSMTAGVAHELNNPLTGVMGVVALVRKEVGEHSDHGELLGMALEQSRRMARIVKDMKTLADGDIQGTRFPLARAVDAALLSEQDRLRRQAIQLEVRADGMLPLIQGDVNRMQQAVEKLIENAIQAMPSGGTLQVRLESVGGEVVKLVVDDTGHGIPESIRERVFDPFFTTRSEAGCTGMGLTVAYSIIEAHHGQIRLASIEGQGTTFTVLLPAVGHAAHLS